MSAIVNVCPFGTASAPAETVWKVLVAPERFGEWQDAKVVEIRPRGPAQPGQCIKLDAPGLGWRFRVTIDVLDLDPHHRWIDLSVHLPFGIVNRERVTLSEVDDTHTLVRFN